MPSNEFSKSVRKIGFSIAGAVCWFIASQAQAGVFNTPHFVTPGNFAIGIEPELMLSGQTSFGVNVRYGHGLSDLSNLNVIIGTGGGDRNFRLGANITFDFFPDIGNQPGIGMAFQGLFVQLPHTGSVETTAIPYVHKTFHMEQGAFEPFVAIPVGISLFQGNYQAQATVVVGSLFQHSEHVRSMLEFGLSMSNTQTYISGGIVYYH